MSKEKATKPEKKTTETATVFVRMDADTVKKLKYIALADGTTQTDIVAGLITSHVEQWEKKNGKITFK